MADSQNSSNSSLFFIYSDLVEQFFDYKRFFLFGGTGSGKSTIINHIEEHALNNMSSAEVIKLSGKDPEACIQASDSLARKIVDDDFTFCLLIDDIDKLFLRQKVSPEESIIAFFNNLCLFFSRADVDGSRICITTSNHPEETFSALDQDYLRFKEYALLRNFYFSNFTNSWSIQYVSPFETLVQDDFKQPFVDISLDPKILEVWKKIIIELTGGHLRLLSFCVSELVRLSSDKELKGYLKDLVEPDSLTKHTHEMIKNHLEDGLFKGPYSKLKSHLFRMSVSDVPLEKQAFLALVAFAQDEHAPPSAAHRQYLELSGLIYRDPMSGAYVIPGSIVRDELLRLSQNLPKKLRYTIHDESETGVFITYHAGKPIHHHITGTHWTLLKALNKADGEVLPFDDIKTLLNKKSEYAVRSAVKRLIEKLDDFGYGDLIHNVRGIGYRID